MRKISIIIVFIVAAISQAGATTFTIAPGDPQNVTFHSRATIESFEGVTNQVTGQIRMDSDTVDSASATFTVEMGTLDTGIGVRNGHMRDNHLHTDRYPQATFTLTSVKEPVKLEIGKPVSFTAVGDLSLHGVTKRIEVPVTVTELTGEGASSDDNRATVLHITGGFPVSLSDFDIPRPQFLMMRVADMQQVTFEFWAKAKDEK